MYFVYSFLLFLGLIILIPVYFCKKTVSRGESLNLRKRLGGGLSRKRNQKNSIWIHAVSVGEVLSLQNLVRLLKERHSSWEINFSSLTDTGLVMAKEKLQNADNFFFIPLDFAVIARKYFKTYRPKVFVLAESEFWPNILRTAKRQGCSVMVINGRISERSFKRYRRFRPLTRKVLENINLFLVQTEQDRKRLEIMGVDSQRIDVVGNLKAEVELPYLTEREISDFKGNLNIQKDMKVIVAGSTRRGEEEQLLRAFLKAKNERGNLLLVLAPRHPKRFEEVEKACRNFSLKVRRRTAVSPDEDWEVLILDTMGELAKFYALSDAAFVGGSLVPWGGHNILEPAFYEKPIFFGPNMKNFAFLADKFVQSGAARIIHEEENILDMFLMNDENEFYEMGKKAKEILNSLRGATEKTLRAIEAFMTEK